MMERAPLKATSATFGPFPAAPGYHSVVEQVFMDFTAVVPAVLLAFVYSVLVFTAIALAFV